MRKLNINWDECANILVLMPVGAFSIIFAVAGGTGFVVFILFCFVFKAGSLSGLTFTTDYKGWPLNPRDPAPISKHWDHRPCLSAWLSIWVLRLKTKSAVLQASITWAILRTSVQAKEPSDWEHYTTAHVVLGAGWRQTAQQKSKSILDSRAWEPPAFVTLRRANCMVWLVTFYSTHEAKRDLDIRGKTKTTQLSCLEGRIGRQLNGKSTCTASTRTWVQIPTSM